MKASKIIGIIAFVLALIVLAAGIAGGLTRGGEALREATARAASIDAHKKAVDKTAPSAAKKVETAVSGVQSAVTDVEEALENIRQLDTQFASASTGDEVLDALRAAGADAMADKLILAQYTEQYDAAFKAVTGAESKLISARDGIASIYAGIDQSHELPSVEKSAEAACDTPAACVEAVKALLNRTAALTTLSTQLQTASQEAAAAAAQVSAADSLPFGMRIRLLLGNSYIGVLFTGVVLLAFALIMLLCAGKFAAAWKKYPIFSTFIALIVLLVIQVYALGFQFETIGQWASYWLNNMLNVLRSNSSVGMIALGMTLVIITGGIDLAVGSTLAGVATVVMVLLDVSANGTLTNAGVTGWPNYLIAIFAGLISGVGVGALIGLGVTKGRVPPFIITLGVMNIVRSVAQYFTKGYKVEVPKAFQVLANTEICGQMLLPIIYWLILAVIMYIIAKHTAFGRHIYAIGSNERTSRLSGINVDRVKLGVYALMGLIVAIAAITQVARLRGVDVASAGSGYEMNAIAAVVVGGTSMAGGRGSIEGTVLGVLIIGIMNNLLVLLGIDAFLANAFTGAIIICAVLMQRKNK